LVSAHTNVTVSTFFNIQLCYLYSHHSILLFLLYNLETFVQCKETYYCLSRVYCLSISPSLQFIAALIKSLPTTSVGQLLYLFGGLKLFSPRIFAYESLMRLKDNDMPRNSTRVYHVRYVAGVS